MRTEFTQKLASYLASAIIAARAYPGVVLGRDRLQSPSYQTQDMGRRLTYLKSLRRILDYSWVATSIGFDGSASLGYGFCRGKKGTRKKVTGQRSRGRVNVMGGIREQDRKRLCFFIKKGDADTFYEQLQQLNEFVKNEWLENAVADFQQKGPKIILILDNASYHKRRDIRENIAQERIHLLC